MYVWRRVICLKELMFSVFNEIVIEKKLRIDVDRLLLSNIFVCLINLFNISVVIYWKKWEGIIV